MILQFTKRQIEPGITSLEIKGSIHCGPECTRLEQQVNELIGAKETRVIFDMTGVTHVDSAAIGAIVRCFAKLKNAGGGLRVACAQPMVNYSMKLTKTDRIIPGYPSVGEAAAGFSSAGTTQA
jgi:anti-sigma B factor antagonist